MRFFLIAVLFFDLSMCVPTNGTAKSEGKWEKVKRLSETEEQRKDANDSKKETISDSKQTLRLNVGVFRLPENISQQRENLEERRRKALKGIDLEKRRERLQKLQNRMSRKEMTAEEKKELEDRLKKIRKVVIERPNENATNLFELNEREGVADYLFQGDIQLTQSQMEQLEQEYAESPTTGSPLRSKRQASIWWNHPKWTYNKVYYFFDANLNARKRKQVLTSLEYIQSRSCINFLQNSTAEHRIRVQDGAGCWSELGMTGGEQMLIIADECGEDFGSVAHEFTHALGIWHTQMRTDRDTYVTVDLTDVPEKEGNFFKMPGDEVAMYTPYEYGSFMHYPANAWVRNNGRPSIIPKDTDYMFTMGSEIISFYDIKMINDHYGCTSWCNKVASPAKCQNGGTPNPRNCASCYCPQGYGGTLCDQRPPGCGTTVAATASWQKLLISLGDISFSYGDTIRSEFSYCNHWITAPSGMKIQTRITNMFNSQCTYGCDYNGIEIKRKAEADNESKVGSMYCCTAFNNLELTSDINPTPIISYNRYWYSNFTVECRYVANAPIVLPPQVPPGWNAVDSNNNCANWAKNGYCTSVLYTVDQKKALCSKTCMIC